jgi:hypothetical protein
MQSKRRIKPLPSLVARRKGFTGNLIDHRADRHRSRRSAIRAKSAATFVLPGAYICREHRNEIPGRDPNWIMAAQAHAMRVAGAGRHIHGRVVDCDRLGCHRIRSMASGLVDREPLSRRAKDHAP